MGKTRSVAKSGAQLICRSLPKREWDGRLTNSARTTFWNCRKKFDWQYLRRLSPRAINIPFLVGGLYHDELERMYTEKTFDEDKTRKRVTTIIEKKSNALSLTPAQSDNVWIQQAMVMGLVRGYAQQYLEKDLKIWDIMECEENFKFALQNKWTSVGKRDMIVREKKKPKRLILVEHKTTSRLDSSYIAKLPLDSQILGYALSVKKETGKIPDAVVYNVAKKSQLRQKVSENFSQYSKRMESEYLSNSEAYFYRETITFSTQDIKNFEEELKRFAKEMARSIDEEYFYKNTTHCTQFGVCPYMPLCIEGPTKENLSRYRERKHLHEELDSKDEK